MNLRGGLGVTEGHGGHVLQDGHLHGTVPAVQESHQGTRVHGAVGDGTTDGAGLDPGSFSWLHVHVDLPLIHQTGCEGRTCNWLKHQLALVLLVANTPSCE